MKFLRFSVVLVVMGGLMLFASCGKGNDPEPSIEEKQLKLLVQTWELTEATYGGTTGNRTSEYSGMQLEISDTDPGSPYNYKTSNIPSATTKTVWPRHTTSGSGDTWTFDDTDPASIIYRGVDNLQITYTVTADLLQLSFNYTGDGFRNSAVEGQWVFKFAPAN